MRRKFVARRYHDISTGHRVHGHENKCRHLHGHNYRIHFLCTAEEGVSHLDKIGRVIDFGIIKSKLCMWLEEHWDHKFLAWENDHIMKGIVETINAENESTFGEGIEAVDVLGDSIVWTPFNPTAENMAAYLVDVVGPEQLAGTGVILDEVIIEETAKCHASYTRF